MKQHLFPVANNKRIVDEWCPYCTQDVKLTTDFKLQKCPNCGMMIAPCSLCDWNTVKCSQCLLNLDMP